MTAWGFRLPEGLTRETLALLDSYICVCESISAEWSGVISG